MKEKCSEEGDCHSVTVSCPVVKMNSDIINDNDVVEQEQNIIPEKTLPHPPHQPLSASDQFTSIIFQTPFNVLKNQKCLKEWNNLCRNLIRSDKFQIVYELAISLTTAKPQG